MVCRLASPCGRGLNTMACDYCRKGSHNEQEPSNSSQYLDSSVAEDADHTDGYRLRTRSTKRFAAESKHTRNILLVTVADERLKQVRKVVYEQPQKFTESTATAHVSYERCTNYNKQANSCQHQRSRTNMLISLAVFYPCPEALGEN